MCELAGVADQYGPLDRVRQAAGGPPVGPPADRGRGVCRGRLSYSAVRAITRLDRPDPGVDEALVALAESGQASILDIERVVRSYHLYAGQDRPPPDQAGRARGVRIVRGGDGTGQVIVSLSDLEVEEFAAALQAFVDRRYRPRPGDESSPEDRKAGEAPMCSHRHGSEIARPW